jgi:AAA domain/Nuclease-related domain
MKPEPGLYPREEPRTTESHAEILVYESLKAHLPTGWYAWHSLRLRENDGIFGEGDFVVADPDRGLLAVEVKGGNVEQRDGRWFQNGHAMHTDPRTQGNEFVRKLISRLERDACAPSAYGVATCFPDVSFDAPPDQDDLSRTTIGKQDLPWLDERLKSLMEHALPRSRRPRGRWIDHLHKIWGETWIPKLGLGHRAHLEDTERAKLDADQFRILDMVEANSNLLVEGGAGTGKTLIAREAACRFAEKGSRVLLLCFTNALAEWLRKSIGIPNVRVAALGKLALEIKRSSGTAVNEPSDKSGWDQLLLEVAADILPRIGRDWDTVLLDEAQDLSAVDWDLMGELSRDKRFWVFHDPAQHFWTDRDLPNFLTRFAQVRLPSSYRCPLPIMALANVYRDAGTLDGAMDSIRGGIAEGTIGIVACPSDSSVPDKIASEIGKFLSSGFKPSDIAVVSVRGQNAARTFGLTRIGAYRLVKADDRKAQNEIVDDTFLRFKGLERPAVIVTDLNLIHDRREVRMYIAITRALSALRIVAPRDAVGVDHILRKFSN